MYFLPSEPSTSSCLVCLPSTTFISDRKFGCWGSVALGAGFSSILSMLSTLLEELRCDWSEHIIIST